MCGRVSVAVNFDEMIQIIQHEYNVESPILDYDLPRYNVSPGQRVISIINDGVTNRVGLLRWGFVPSWAKDEKIGYKLINAKAETLGEKVSFKNSFKRKRCIILVDGFYEWKKEGITKIPIRFKLKQQNIFSLAGLYSTYIKEDGNKLHTCTVITTNPNNLMEPIHNRMPVILTKETEQIWLNPKEQDLDLLSSLLIPYDSKKMEAYKVSTIVNNTRNESRECIIPI